MHSATVAGLVVAVCPASRQRLSMPAAVDDLLLPGSAVARSPTTPGGGIGPVMGCRWIFARIRGPIAAGVVGNATDGVELL
ncbi:hypothetical protein [Pseudonocardia sp.]|jgi:hypothetical protein|uniref:hypothetical protein n=1 Tax=Pseudonocardia sp. TaxID=60912 RepID=UPI0031FCD3FA